MSDSDRVSLDGPEKYWQFCDMPECTNEVPKAKGICDECTGRA